jgi:hypothetical protein
LVLDHNQLLIDNTQEGGKGWVRKLRKQYGGKKLGAPLFSLSFD